MGLLLSLLCARFTIRHLLDRPGYNLLMAGFAASLALLCKQEFGAACYLMLAFVIVMEFVLRRAMRPLLAGIAACAPGVVLWVAIYGWFFWTLTPSYMLHANWVGLPGTFGQLYIGHLYALNGQRFIPREMVGLAICAAVTIALWFLLARTSRGPRNVALAILVAIAVAYRLGSLAFVAEVITVFLVFSKGMFFIGCVLVAHSTYDLLKTGERRRLAEAAFGIFALVPALRVFAVLVPYGYSIHYAMPLFLVFVIALSRCIKAATPTVSVERQRGLVNYLLAVEVVMLAVICIPQGNKRTSRLETSWGQIYLAPTDASVARQILDFASRQKRQGRRVAVLPEAPMLYALTGTEAPSRWYTLLPGFVSPAQEDVYIADLNRAAPDYVLLTARRTHEYGVDYFGIDYNQKIYNWIESNYRIAGVFGRFGSDPSGSALSALLYQRLDPVERNRIGALISDRPG